MLHNHPIPKKKKKEKEKRNMCENIETFGKRTRPATNDYTDTGWNHNLNVSDHEKEENPQKRQHQTGWMTRLMVASSPVGRLAISTTRAFRPPIIPGTPHHVFKFPTAGAARIVRAGTVHMLLRYPRAADIQSNTSSFLSKNVNGFAGNCFRGKSNLKPVQCKGHVFVFLLP